MKNYYYIVKTAYDGSGDILIGSDELELALYAFITGQRMVFSSGGAIRGSDIISVLPDWNRMMGYNHNYKPQSEDWYQIRKTLGDKPQHFLAERKNVVEHLIRSGSVSLIGKNLPQDEALLASGGKLALKA